jgi:hypothetical protein
MEQKLFSIINNKNDLAKYQKGLTWVKDGLNAEFDDECGRVRNYMAEKSARNEDCKVVFLYVESGKTVAEQRNSDAVYHVIMDISDKDFIINKYRDSQDIVDLKLTDGALLLLPHFCELFSDKEIVYRTKLNKDNIHQYRNEVYTKFKVSDQYSLRRKAIKLGLFEETCPVCAKRKRKKNIIPLILSFIMGLPGILWEIK